MSAIRPTTLFLPVTSIDDSTHIPLLPNRHRACCVCCLVLMDAGCHGWIHGGAAEIERRRSQCARSARTISTRAAASSVSSARRVTLRPQFSPSCKPHAPPTVDRARLQSPSPFAHFRRSVFGLGCRTSLLSARQPHNALFLDILYATLLWCFVLRV